MAYTSLNQMYTHILDPVRGWWDERQLSRVLPVNASCPDQLYAGSVGHMTNNGGTAEFLDGIQDASGAAHSTQVLPMFLRNNYYSGTGTSEYNDNDVRSVTGNISGNSGAVAGAPGDQGVSCLVGTGGYELSTSEFKSDDAFVPGSIVTSPKNGATNAGKLTLSTADRTPAAAASTGFEKVFVGIVSVGGTGGTANYRGTNMITFYTHLFQASVIGD